MANDGIGQEVPASMAYLIHFRPTNMTRALYDEVWARLREVAQDTVPERSIHLCFGPDSALQVVDVWATLESFQRFGETLLPILADLGVDIGTPEVHVVRGQAFAFTS